MPTPCREQIVAASKSVLALIATPSGVTVERGRTMPITDDALPLLVLLQDPDTPHGEDESFTGERAYTLNIAVEGVIAGATDLDARAQLAVLRAAAERAMLSDATLGGIARDVRLMTEPPPPRLQIDSGLPVAAFAIGFEIDFATLETDPFTFA